MHVTTRCIQLAAIFNMERSDNEEVPVAYRLCTRKHEPLPRSFGLPKLESSTCLLFVLEESHHSTLSHFCQHQKHQLYPQASRVLKSQIQNQFLLRRKPSLVSVPGIFSSFPTSAHIVHLCSCLSLFLLLSSQHYLRLHLTEPHNLIP